MLSPPMFDSDKSISTCSEYLITYQQLYVVCQSDTKAKRGLPKGYPIWSNSPAGGKQLHAAVHLLHKLGSMTFIQSTKQLLEALRMAAHAHT